MPTGSNAANNINARAVAVQQADGIDVGPEWWEKNVTVVVGNDADEQTMFECFMAAYERDFPKDANGQRHAASPPTN